MGEILKLLAKIAEGILQGVRKGLCFLWRGFAGYCGRHQLPAQARRMRAVGDRSSVRGHGPGQRMDQPQAGPDLRAGPGQHRRTGHSILSLPGGGHHRKVPGALGLEGAADPGQSIFSYEGIIRAGYDFEKIHVDVDYGDKRITVTLPEAYIINNDILPDSLLVYSEDTNIFTPIRITDFNDTQAGMKQQGQEDAVNAGILEAARANAEVLIRGFLSGAFDLNEYELIFK